MRNFYIIPNLEKSDSVETAEKIRAFVVEKGGNAVVTGSVRLRKGEYQFSEPIPENTDAIITLGGDGTMIQAAHHFLNTDIPLLGINLGHVGFLTETDKENSLNAVEKLLSEDFFIEERLILDGKVKRDGKVIFEAAALNDVVLHSDGGVRAVHFEFLVNNEHIRKYFGDGMIISTPTGSTAYSLSCGGPIVMPSAEIILATPINPHSLISRSIALPGEVLVTLKVTGERGETSVATFDGTVFSGLLSGDELEIKKSEKKVKLIRLHKDSFIDILRTKLEN